MNENMDYISESKIKEASDRFKPGTNDRNLFSFVWDNDFNKVFSSMKAKVAADSHELESLPEMNVDTMEGDSTSSPFEVTPTNIPKSETIAESYKEMPDTPKNADYPDKDSYKSELVVPPVGVPKSETLVETFKEKPATPKNWLCPDENSYKSELMKPEAANGQTSFDPEKLVYPKKFPPNAVPNSVLEGLTILPEKHSRPVPLGNATPPATLLRCHQTEFGQFCSP